MNLDASFNPWTMSKLQCKHTIIAPEVRYWLRRPMFSHFLSAHVTYASYDIKCSKKRYEGNMFAVGLGYGYSFPINKRMNVTPYVGGGIKYSRDYIDPANGDFNIKRSYKPAITRVGVSVNWILR